MLKPSRYNLQTRDEQGASLWFNTASGARLMLEPVQQAGFDAWLATAGSAPDTSQKPLRRALPAVSRQDPSPGTLPLEALLNGGFLVDADTDEQALLLERAAQNRLQTDHISLTISLTSDCNLACPYCVINTTERSGGMSPAVQAALLKWWDRELVSRKTCSLEWMGGEPLLYPETLLELGSALTSRARLAGVRLLEHSIITNGTCLTPTLATRLQGLGVSHLQITLDGDAEVHERCRPSRDGAASFTQIVASIKACAALFALRVRVNLSSQNCTDYRALLQRLAQEELADAVQVYPARVFEPESKGACGDFSHCTLTPQRFGKLATEFALDALEQGFASPGLPSPASGGYCGAYHRSYFVVGPDGSLYRCPARVGQPLTGAVGSVFAVPSSPTMVRNQQRYDGLGPTKEKGCFECKLLPSCLGGCPEESAVSRVLLDECSPWRFKLKKHLMIEHEVQKTLMEDL